MWNYLATINNKVETAVIFILVGIVLAVSIVIMRKIWRAKKLKFWGIEVEAPLIGKKK